MRQYLRLKKCLKTNKITKDYFYTIKISEINKDLTYPSGLIGLGYDEKDILRKIWLTDYQTQQEYVKRIKSVKDSKIFHYIGWFTQSKMLQIYWYHTNKNDLSTPILNYKPDYFGSSITYDELMVPIKYNEYAIRVPINQCMDIIKEFNIRVSEIQRNWVNISYRSNEEITISYLKS